MLKTKLKNETESILFSIQKREGANRGWCLFHAFKWCPFCPGITVRFVPECSIELIVWEISGGNCSAMLSETQSASIGYKYPVFNQKMESAIFRGLSKKINLCSY
jgi:hypothetical protein